MDQNSKIRVPGITSPPVRLQHTSIEEWPGGVSVMKLNIKTPVPDREITSELHTEELGYAADLRRWQHMDETFVCALGHAALLFPCG